jgi:hypothetical protein
MASFRAHLSPNEEATLCRIATGTSDPTDLREADIKRLKALGLIEEDEDGLLATTERGVERSQVETLPLSKPLGQRRLKVRRLPF